MTPWIFRGSGVKGALGCVVLASVLVLVGCVGGGTEDDGPSTGRPGSDGKDTQRRVSAPQPKQSIEEAARQLQAAAASGDCDQLKPLSFSGLTALDEAGCARLVGRLRGFETKDSAEYGTGGVVDFTTEGAPGTMLFALGRDRNFKWVTPLSRQADEEVVGTRPARGNSLDSTAAAAVKALRRGQCAQLAEAASGIVPRPEAPRKACEKRKSLRASLSGDRAVRPDRLGANSRVAFYSLLPKPRGPYFTLVLLQDGERSAFFRDFPTAPGRGR
jgi:hypothetical protein